MKNKSFERAMKKHRRYIKMGGHMEIYEDSAKIPCKTKDGFASGLRDFLKDQPRKPAETE